MMPEAAADIETTGLLSTEVSQARPSRTWRLAVVATALLASFAFVLHRQQPRSTSASVGSSIVAQAVSYDCDAGRWNANNGWSEPKKEWCCTYESKGCPGDQVNTAPQIVSGGVVPGSNPGNYDCDAGRWNAHNGWSPEKQAWCCDNQQKGCANDPLVTGVAPPVAAPGAVNQNFAGGAQIMQGAVANPNNYNCDAGRWNANNGWSENKRAWCCSYQQKGCRGDQVNTAAKIISPGAVLPGSNPNNYDCDAGRWNANNGWSVGKKTWCCANQQKGCAGDQVDTGR